MKTLLIVCTLLASSSLAADTMIVTGASPTPAPTEKVLVPLPALGKTGISSYMSIDPKSRVGDYKQAFEQLRMELGTGKVQFQLTNGTSITNIIDMTPMTNSTLILFRYNSMQGVQLQVVKVEEILGLTHS